MVARNLKASRRRYASRKSTYYTNMSRRSMSIAQRVPRARLSLNTSQVVNIKRTAVVYRSTTLVSNSQTYEFRLGYLPSYTELTALFDQYRIVRVDMKFIPSQTDAQVGATAPMKGYLVLVNDYDDATSYGDVTLALQCNNHRICELGKTIRHTVYPRAAMAVYSGLTTTGYATSAKNQWFDMASPNTSFYGVKDWFQNESGVAMGFMVTYTCYIQCRKIR